MDEDSPDEQDSQLRPTISPRELIRGRRTYQRNREDPPRASPMPQIGRNTPYDQDAHDNTSEGSDDEHLVWRNIPHAHEATDDSRAADEIDKSEKLFKRLVEPCPDIFPKWRIFLVIALCGIHIFGGSMEWYPAASEAPSVPHKIPHSCHDELQALKDEYPNQDPSFWPSLEYNILGVLSDPPRPSFITFLYNESTSTVLLDKIVDATHGCMHPQSKPIVLNKLNLSDSINDFGVIIEKYKEELRKSRVMIVKNLQDISGIASRAFHDLCDSYNPIIDRYVVYFSLFYTHADWEEFPNPNDLASDLLKRRWDREISADTASALIARVTEAVLVLRKIY
uniref:Uncharacterized protein n=1 Tax=Nyssomyia neivai TaxID=330878 RepID=A0A1L8DCH1_9DIPT